MIDDLFVFREVTKKQFETTDRTIKKESLKLNEQLNNMTADLETKLETLEKQQQENFENLTMIMNKNKNELGARIDK